MEVTYSVKENPFNRLRTHATMISINSTLVPWLIAEFGIHYGDWDNVKTAMPMITHVIVSQQLGGYTERTFPAAIDGHRVEQVAFTKFVCLFNFPAYIDCNVGYWIPSSQAPASPSLSIEEAGTDSPASSPSSCSASARSASSDRRYCR